MSSEQGQVPVQPHPATWRSPHHYYVGVDLGQSQDPTALCILEACEEVGDPTEPARYVYDVRHLMRFTLGMSYPTMVQEIGLIMMRPPLSGSPTELIIDETGVGRAVGDSFNEAGLKPVKVTISGHSLRSGFLTSAAARGASVFKMMDVSRHKSVDTFAWLYS
jgi:hypothetical protein